MIYVPFYPRNNNLKSVTLIWNKQTTTKIKQNQKCDHVTKGTNEICHMNKTLCVVPMPNILNDNLLEDQFLHLFWLKNTNIQLE